MSQNHNLVDAAEDLIQEHFELEPNLEKVIWIDPDKTAEIRLLEINPETPPLDQCCRSIFPATTNFLMQ